MLTNKQMIRNLTKMIGDKTVHLSQIKKQIKVYLNDGFDINSRYLKGRNLAHYVVKKNVTGLLSFLSKNGLNLNLCDDNFDAPIHLAIKYNRETLVKELIKSGIDVNLGSEFDMTPLHVASSEGRLKIVELLLKAGADSSFVDERNFTPLDYAKDEHNEEIVKILNKYQNGDK